MRRCALMDVIQHLDTAIPFGAEGVFVTNVTADSRKVAPGALFVAVEGGRFDGHDYLEEVVEKGCAAVVVKAGKGKGFSAVPVISVDDPRKALPSIAAAFYGHPERELVLTGITGTNGKTTTSYILESIIKSAGFSPGVVGTVTYRYEGYERPATLTTPESDELFKLFREMVDNGVTHVIMEVSSHSLIQDRLAGMEFDVAVFTNLSRDHMDFHGSMEEYFQAKKELFANHLKETGSAVVITHPAAMDVPAPDWGVRLSRELQDSGVSGAKLLQCGDDTGDIWLSNIHMDLDGIEGVLNTPEQISHFKTKLTGGFNLENILAAAGAGFALGFTSEQICKGIGRTGQVPGRLEKVGDVEPRVFVDYAHTSDALKNVIAALRTLGSNRLIVVFGCGGDRDRGKRQLMGEVAARGGDVVIITSDNPRNEEPMEIIGEVEEGVKVVGNPSLERHDAEHLLLAGMKGYDIIESRREAIEVVIGNCASEDVVLISGKGHEDYQIIGDRKTYFDDRKEVMRCLVGRRK